MKHSLNNLSNHVRWFTPDPRTDRPILGAVVGQKASLMLDAGASPSHAREFLDALEKAGLPAPSYLVLTHWHWDHVFGMSALDVPILAQQGTAEEVKKLASYSWSDAALDARVKAGTEIAFCCDMIKAELPDRSELTILTPDIVFADFLSVDLGDVTCELHHVGGDHAADSSVLFVPEDKVLFLGDAISQCIYNPLPHYTAEKVLSLLDTLEAFEAEYYLESHNNTVLTKDDFRTVAHGLRAAAEVVKQVGDDPERIRSGIEACTPGITIEDIEELTTLFVSGLRVSKKDTV